MSAGAPSTWGEAARAVQRLDVAIRVLRGCGYCGFPIMGEAEFLVWLDAPRDCVCPWCRAFTRRAIELDAAKEAA